MLSRLSETDFDRLRDLRARRPSAIGEALAERRRRSVLAPDGKIFIVAADHPARGALAVRANRMAMASRYELLDRLAVALSRPGVDGVLGTPDIVEDLAALGLLEGKIVVGSMNRGGLRSACFEIDDRYTGYDVNSLVASGIDFAKALIRIDLEEVATASSLEATARAVTAAASVRLPIILEPFISRRVDGQLVNDLSTDAVIASVGIASGLGASSAYTWLKLPVVDEMDRVMASTTLPTLLLGGDSGADPDEIFAGWEKALALPGVRGLTAGRALLYPPDGEVAAAVDTAAALVHPEEV